MHDLDQPVWGSHAEFTQDEDSVFGAPASEYENAQPGVLNDAEEMEMASDLLSVGSEQELDQFLGKLIGSVSKKLRRSIKGPMGNFLGGALKQVAKSALPALGAVAGSVIPGAGTLAGGALGGAASQLLGLEMEGLSPEDQEFETARRLVRLGADAVANAAGQANADAAPAQAARHALASAARRHAPGLLSNTVAGRVRSNGHASHGAAEGRWIRRGNQIILLGA